MAGPRVTLIQASRTSDPPAVIPIDVRTPATLRSTTYVVPDQRVRYVTDPVARTGAMNDRIDAVAPARANISVGADLRVVIFG